MFRIVAVCLCVPLAFILALFYHQIWVGVLGSLYVALTLQAEWAAGRLLAKMGEPELDANGKPKKRRHWNEENPVEKEELHVNPLGGKREVEPDLTYYPPPPPREQVSRAAPASPGAEPVSQAAGNMRRSAPQRLPSLPKFHGRAHEVLGIRENARTRTIVNAFRHWIKRFHPDQAQSLPAGLANSRVQRLTEAKELLLERRRARKSA